jgi:hypothetical protein
VAFMCPFNCPFLQFLLLYLHPASNLGSPFVKASEPLRILQSLYNLSSKQTIEAHQIAVGQDLFDLPDKHGDPLSAIKDYSYIPTYPLSSDTFGHVRRVCNSSSSLLGHALPSENAPKGLYYLL